MLKLYNVINVQCYKCTILQMYNVTNIQCYQCTMLQMYNVTNVQCYKCTMLQMYNVTVWNATNIKVAMNNATTWTGFYLIKIQC